MNDYNEDYINPDILEDFDELVFSGLDSHEDLASLLG
jgi:hypothetical protein